MKKLPYFRHVIYGLLFALAFVVGLVVFPIAYLLRKWTRKTKFLPLLIWLNSDEPDETSNDYGDAGWRERNGIDIATMNAWQRFIVSYRWAALRNPHYNLKLLLAPKQGKIENTFVKDFDGDADPMTFRNYEIRGKQHATYYIDGWKYFRYSFTTPINVFVIKRLWNVQLGTNSVRYIYKMRFGRMD